MSGRVLPAYVPALPVGSLVFVPGSSSDPALRRSVTALSGMRGLVGIVSSVQRDVRSGRVLSYGCSWYDLTWRLVCTGPVAASTVSPWSPGVGCGADCAPVVGFGFNCAGCGYRV